MFSSFFLSPIRRKMNLKETPVYYGLKGCPTVSIRASYPHDKVDNSVVCLAEAMLNENDSAWRHFILIIRNNPHLSGSCHRFPFDISPHDPFPNVQ